MGRWKPDARGRLARAAMDLYAEQGFERTTVAEIAQRAGLTESTFFRTFADKREVLFAGYEPARELLTGAIAQAPPSVTPLAAVTAALGSLCEVFLEQPEVVRQRSAIVAASADLRERDRSKHALLGAAMAGALADRGVPALAAELAAETGLVVFRAALTRWLAAPGGPALTALFHQALAELRGTVVP